MTYYTSSGTLNSTHSLGLFLALAREIISGKFPRAEIKSFQTDVDEGWNNFEIIISHVTTALVGGEVLH